MAAKSDVQAAAPAAEAAVPAVEAAAPAIEAAQVPRESCPPAKPVHELPAEVSAEAPQQQPHVQDEEQQHVPATDKATQMNEAPNAAAEGEFKRDDQHTAVSKPEEHAATQYSPLPLSPLPEFHSPTEFHSPLAPPAVHTPPSRTVDTSDSTPHSEFPDFGSALGSAYMPTPPPVPPRSDLVELRMASEYDAKVKSVMSEYEEKLIAQAEESNKKVCMSLRAA